MRRFAPIQRRLVQFAGSRSIHVDRDDVLGQGLLDIESGRLATFVDDLATLSSTGIIMKGSGPFAPCSLPACRMRNCCQAFAIFSDKTLQ
jgi:hypothetical protein